MHRKKWSPRMLRRRVRPGGLFGRPVVAFRMRMSELPARLSEISGGCCYRWWNLEGMWPPEWVALFKRLDHGWKYADIFARGDKVEVYLRGYTGKSPRPLLPEVAAVIADLQMLGVRVDVRP